jgi:hypothetical protein
MSTLPVVSMSCEFLLSVISSIFTSTTLKVLELVADFAPTVTFILYIPVSRLTGTENIRLVADAVDGLIVAVFYICIIINYTYRIT